MPVPLSACILTKDSAGKIANCLKSVEGLVDEILILDQQSTDNTIEICKEYDAKIFEFDRNAVIKFGFSYLRNYLLDRATNDWCLVIDSDEVVTAQLKHRIKGIVEGDIKEYVGYRIYTQTFAFKRYIKMLSGYSAFPRLLRKSKVHFTSKVHENVVVQGQIGLIQEPLLHFTYDSWEELYRKSQLYSLLEAQQIVQNERSKSYFKELLDIFKHLLWLLILQQGVLDGLVGLRIAKAGILSKIMAYKLARRAVYKSVL